MPNGVSYNGQLYQTATTQLTLSTDTGFSYTLKTWKDCKTEFGAESKIANNTDGSVAGYTTDPVKTSAGLKMRLDEWDDLVFAWTQHDPTLPILQAVFDFSLVYGNSIQKRRTDSGKIKFQKEARDLPASSDPNEVDLPMLLLDFKRNGAPVLVFPV